MLMLRERQYTFRTPQGWAIYVLTEAGAIRECEEHGWMKDRADPHARDRAVEMARSEVPPGMTVDQAVAAIEDFLSSIGDSCPECPPECTS